MCVCVGGGGSYYTGWDILGKKYIWFMFLMLRYGMKLALNSWIGLPIMITISRNTIPVSYKDRQYLVACHVLV